MTGLQSHLCERPAHVDALHEGGHLLHAPALDLRALAVARLLGAAGAARRRRGRRPLGLRGSGGGLFGGGGGGGGLLVAALQGRLLMEWGGGRDGSK